MTPDFDLDLLRLLAAVDEGGSFAAAARSLGVSRATVRRRLALLEEQVGVILVRRERDLLTPTDAGATLARGARSLLAEASALVAQASSTTSEPSGLVRVAMASGEPPFLATMALQAIRRRWPKVHLALIDTAWPHTLLTEHADLALTFAEPAPRGPWQVSDLFCLKHRLYASADYLRRSGPLRSVDDLRQHDLLYWEPPEGGAPGLVDRDGHAVPLPIGPVFRSNNIHTLRTMTIAGAGVAWFPDGGFPAPGEAPGALQAILEDQVGTTRWLRLLLPNAYRDLPRARALADALVALLERLRLLTG